MQLPIPEEEHVHLDNVLDPNCLDKAHDNPYRNIQDVCPPQLVAAKSYKHINLNKKLRDEEINNAYIDKGLAHKLLM